MVRRKDLLPSKVSKFADKFQNVLDATLNYLEERLQSLKDRHNDEPQDTQKLNDVYVINLNSVEDNQEKNSCPVSLINP